jgi:hypothetical protein
MPGDIGRPVGAGGSAKREACGVTMRVIVAAVFVALLAASSRRYV